MDLLSIQKLLQQGIFKIPSYQRGYSWQVKQVQEFIDDLQEASEIEEHYTGTITVVQKEETKIIKLKRFKLFDVVDGQQRLTSFTIFIHCIYIRMKDLKYDKEGLDDILLNVIFKKETILQLHDEVHQFYIDFISDNLTEQYKPKNKSEQNILNAKKYISRFLNDKSIDEVGDFYTTLMDKFKINFFVLSKELDVGVVFETMNNRGLPLTKMDMVKNYLVYLASKLGDIQLAKQINIDFGSIYENLMNIDASSVQEDDVLRYSFIIYTGNSGENIYQDIKNLLPKKEAKRKDILSYLTFLKETSEIYSKIKIYDFKDREVKILMKKILWLETSGNFFPLLISLCKKYKESEILIPLQLIEKYSFRVFKIIDKRSSTGKNKLRIFSHEILLNKPSINEVCKWLVDEIKDYAKDEVFRLALDVKNFFIQQDPKEISYFFYEYECYLHNYQKSSFKLLDFEDFKKSIKDKTLSIEHIAPQKPEHGKELSQVQKLGNLTITYDNTKLSNKPFHTKMSIYKQSNLLVENNLIKHSTSRWEDSNIGDRTKELLTFALDRWKI